MKRTVSILTLLLVGSLSTTVQAQTKDQCIKFLQDKADEIVGQIKILGTSRYLVEESSLSMKNGLINLQFKSSGGENISEFCPLDIDSIAVGNIDKSSPVGTLRICMIAEMARSQEKIGKELKKPEYSSIAYFNFLQKDPKNAVQIKKVLLRLQEIIEAENLKTPITEALDEYTSEKSFWYSNKPNSTTYELETGIYSGGQLMFYFSMEEVTMASTTNGRYLAVVPMEDIDEVILDKKNARPASLLLKSGRKEFMVYRLDAKLKKYTFYKEAEILPMFVPFTTEIGLLDLELSIEDTKKQCGGGKIKSKVVK